MSQDDADTETRTLSSDPRFQALLSEARASKAQGGYSTAELERELGITERDKAIAQTYRQAVERLEVEQGTEATEVQIRQIELELTAARYLRADGALATLAKETGLPEDEIRAAAVGLTAVGLATVSGTD